jgi:hypothetical protein
MSKLTTHSTEISTTLGARALVLGAFAEAAIPALTNAQCNSVSEIFKRAIEDIMAMMDDVSLPGQFHSTLLDLTNSLLATLRQQQTS